MNKPLNIAILIFDDVEVLDFSGPFEVFSVANRDVESPPFNVFTVADSETVVTRGGLRVRRNCPLEECPSDVLLVPGGVGIQQLLERSDIVEWVTARAGESQLVASVCTGAVLLGRCGLLDGISATTHHRCLDQLREVAPQTRIVTEQRYVDTGRVITSAGISAGIDMSLHVVGRLISPATARAVAERMEYRWEEQQVAISDHHNTLGQPIGPPLKNWVVCSRPPRSTMSGRFCRVEPIDPDIHAEPLFDAFQSDTEGRNWTYLPYGPFASFDDFATWLHSDCTRDDPLFYTIVDAVTGAPVGLASYLRIQPDIGTIEVGHIHYSPRLQRTAAATETMYLMMSRVFDELGYRRYEWKCDALNQPSRNAAQRLGFAFEGVFRQATIYKERSRDTAWFSITDEDWPQLKQAYQRWLRSENHDDQGQQHQRLAQLIRHERTKQ